MRVEAYRNLTNDCISVRKAHGNLIGHYDVVIIADADFVVQPAGRDRVRDEGVKNVHAFVRGEFVDGTSGQRVFANHRRVTYNPYQHDTFVYADTGKPIKHADRAYVTTQGVFV